MSKLKAFSIIIPIKEFSQMLKSTVKTIESQLYPKDLIEILIVHNSKVQSSVPDYLNGKARVIRLPFPSRSIARNVGANAAQNSTLIFLDDNSLFTKKDALLRLSKIDEQVIQLSIRMTAGLKNEPIYQAYERLSYYRTSGRTWNIAERNKWLDSAALVIKKKTLKDINGYNKAFTRYEDRELAYRLRMQGIQFHPALSIYVNKVLEPTSIVSYFFKASVEVFYRIKFLWQYNRVGILKDSINGAIKIFNIEKYKAIKQGQTTLTMMLFSSLVAVYHLLATVPCLIIVVFSRNSNSHDSNNWAFEEVGAYELTKELGT